MSMFLLKHQKRRAQTLCFHMHRVCSSDEFDNSKSIDPKTKKFNRMNVWHTDYKYQMYEKNMELKLINFHRISVWLFVNVDKTLNRHQRHPVNIAPIDRHRISNGSNELCYELVVSDRDSSLKCIRCRFNVYMSS